MASPRIVSVFGATGTQGSAVIRGLLEEGTFTPRAITRDPSSEAARKLAAQGVEVAVFGVTVPIFPLKEEGEGPNEIVQGRNMVDAAKEVGVRFFIFSSGPDVEKLSGGKYRIAVTDQKAKVEDYLKASGLPHASLLPGTFLENFWKHGLLQQSASGTGFDISIPILSATDVNGFTWVGRDVPAAVLALLKNYQDVSKNILGQSCQVVNEEMTYPEVAALAAKALGVEVTFTSAPRTGVALRDDMAKCLVEFKGFYTARDPALVALGVEFSTVEEFMEVELKARFAAP
ncbi:hypothetical protein C8R46DRAFT_1223634 [Mycena filopes]|nr:hypothetical protein C8R46DRAFT_1223634 [Mycena filopes]